MHLVFMFQQIFFRILRSWKARFSHRSISHHKLYTKEFQLLGGQKSCKELKKSKKLQIRGVETSIMPIGNTNIHIQNNVSEYINKHSFISLLWIYSCNELKWWQNYNLSSIIISNSQIEILVSYSKSTKVKVNLSFPNSKFEVTFSTYVFCKSFWHYRVLKNEYWT
jgi:hypothetical protein